MPVSKSESQDVKKKRVHELLWCSSLQKVQEKRLRKNSSELHNFRRICLIICLTSAEGDYCFKYASTGCKWRASDSNKFQDETTNAELQDNSLNWPEHSIVVRDGEFTKPYSIIQHKVKDITLSCIKQRRLVENAFKILASKLLFCYRCSRCDCKELFQSTQLVVKDNWIITKI